MVTAGILPAVLLLLCRYKCSNFVIGYGIAGHRNLAMYFVSIYWKHTVNYLSARAKGVPPFFFLNQSYLTAIFYKYHHPLIKYHLFLLKNKIPTYLYRLRYFLPYCCYTASMNAFRMNGRCCFSFCWLFIQLST